MPKLLKPISQHKFITGIIFLLVFGGGYYSYNKIWSTNGVVRYVVAYAQKDILIISILGSGQVSTSNQVDIKPKVSGDAIYIGVKNGQEVKAGTLIVRLDTGDAQKTVRDAEANLEVAKLSLEKLQKPADILSVLQAENALVNAKESKQKAEDDLVKAREDGFNTIANTFLDLPSVMAGLQDILFENDFNSNQSNLYYYSDAVKLYNEKVNQYRDSANNTYKIARETYDQNFEDYKSTSRFSDATTIKKLIEQTYDTSKNIAEAVKNTNNLIQFYQDKLTEQNISLNSLSNTHLSSLNTYTGETNTHLLNLLSIKRTIQTDEETIISAERTIIEKTEFLAKLKAGAEALDIQSQELTIKQKENSLFDAKEKLADYFIRAPFDGVITKVGIKKTDTISSGTIVATLITKQKLAEISLNEVDVAKIKVGQKTTLTFDAVPDLSIVGEVAEIDSVGEVSQGVVTYALKIGFDTQDERVKSGMSVSAMIITEVKPNILLIPNSAVKSKGKTSYVEIVEGDNKSSALAVNGSGVVFKNTPRQQIIETGLANDEFTEVVSGLKEGDFIVTRTIQPTSGITKTQSTSSLKIPGITGGGDNRGGMKK